MTMPEVPGVKESIDALKHTPVLLVMVLVVAAVLGMVTFLTLRRSEQMNAQNVRLLEMVQECIRPNKSSAVFGVPHRFWYLNK